jgi:hypothetical protein
MVALAVFGAGAASATTAPIRLLVPQGTAFAVLGYDCGGIKEHAYATGFDTSLDPAAGYPTGDVFLTTTCSAGGRGGRTFTVSAWTSDTWDLTGALLSHAVLAGAPAVDPNLVASDPLTGNEIYNATGTVPTAWLQLAPTFTPRPRVIAISTSDGPAAGGTSVTISGDAFGAATGVFFGSMPAANYTINSDASLTATAPADASGISPDVLDVTVVSDGGPSFASSSDEFTYYGQPTVTGVNPNRGPLGGGYYVTVAGTNFLGTTGVSDGDTPTAFQVIDNSTLSVYMIPGETAGDSTAITVTSPGGTSPATSADQFIYDPPAKLALSPAKGPPGTKVKAKGSYFGGGEVVTVSYVTGLSDPAPTELTICTTTTTASGSFACKGKIPAKATAGAKGIHSIVATGASGDSAGATFKRQ